MKILKRISMIFLISLILFSVKAFAGYEIADPNSLEDPIYNIKRQDVQSGTLESLNSFVSKFESSDAVIGIDVSSWQGEIDWKQVADSGVKFAIIRCGYRTTVTGKVFEDAYFKKNIQGAINNGIYTGVYFFSAAINEEEALEEANMTLDLIRGYDIKYFVSYDFETFLADGYRTDNLSVDQINKNGQTYLNKIRENGYTGCMYGSASYLKDKWRMNEFANDATWVAHYNVNKPSYNGHYDMWQCSESGQVNGISGGVDIDVDYTFYFRHNNIDITPYMFDARFYADCNPDLKEAFGYNEQALRQHFEVYGKAEGRYATPIFSAKYYLNKYSDLKRVYGNNYAGAYDHFIVFGAKEGRQGSKYVSSVFYLDNYGDLKRAFYRSKTKALAHFFQYGSREGRQGSSEFDVKSYKTTTSAYYQKHLGNDYLKYMALDNGGRPTSDSNVDITPYMFDARFYADHNSDLKRAYGYDEASLRAHYIAFGRKEGRQASRIFDPKFYLENNSDLKRAYGNDYEGAYYHFITFGAKEGRKSSGEFEVKKYLQNYHDLDATYGPFYTKAMAHYATFGANEGRKGN